MNNKTPAEDIIYKNHKSIMEYYKEGFSDYKISDKFDVSRASICKWRLKNNLLANHKSWNNLKLKDIPTSIKNIKIKQIKYDEESYLIPVVKLKKKQQSKQYYKEYAKRPEVKKRISEYLKRPEVKERRNKNDKKKYWLAKELNSTLKN